MINRKLNWKIGIAFSAFLATTNILNNVQDNTVVGFNSIFVGIETPNNDSLVE
jgi:hypothetical protein